MKSLYTIVAVLAAVALIGSVVAMSLVLRQASAIIPDSQTIDQFKKMTEQMQRDTVKAASNDDPNALEIIWCKWKDDVSKLFGIQQSENMTNNMTDQKTR